MPTVYLGVILLGTNVLSRRFLNGEPMIDPVGGITRAYLLMSGGLDSRLAACVLREQGIAVTAISYTSPFFGADNARSAARLLGIPLVVEDFSTQILELVEHPPHGFGSHLNPCIDCHTAMIRLAGRRAERDGFQCVATGEVLNQRPMSQNRRSLDLVAEGSGYGMWLIRPLSARLLAETEPERRGWVDRSRLLDLNGRSRKPQYALAARYGVTDYPASAGGCRLTEPNFAARMKDLRNHGQVKDLHAIEMLRVGRHFRLNDKVKVIVGRDEADNAKLESLAVHGEAILDSLDLPGPIVLVSGDYSAEDLMLAAQLCVRHSDCKTGPAEIRVKTPSGERRVVAEGLPDEQVNRLRVR